MDGGVCLTRTAWLYMGKKKRLDFKRLFAFYYDHEVLLVLLQSSSYTLIKYTKD
jgi:hypothetical protein